MTRISVVAAGPGHRAGADERLAGAAGQHDDAGAAVPEAVDGLLLVGPQRPVGLVAGRSGAPRRRRSRRRSSAGQPSLSSSCLRWPRSEGCTSTVGRRRAARRAAAAIFLCRRTSSSTGRSVRVQDEAVRRVLLQREAAVAVHRVGDVDEQGVRHRVAAVGEQGVDDLLGVVAGGAGVPQAERGEAVGVDVLGGALELGERRDRAAARPRRRGGRPRAAASCRSGRSGVRQSWSPGQRGPGRWCSPARPARRVRRCWRSCPSCGRRCRWRPG